MSGPHSNKDDRQPDDSAAYWSSTYDTQDREAEALDPSAPRGKAQRRVGHDAPGEPEDQPVSVRQLPEGAPQTNNFAILSIIFSIFLAPLGIVFGVLARREIRRYGGHGRSLATAGIAIGATVTALGVVVIFVQVVAAATIEPLPTCVNALVSAVRRVVTPNG